jgi:hypothetical protein
VSGGFYMDSTYVKHTMPMATSLSLLAASLVEFKSGYEAQVRVLLCNYQQLLSLFCFPRNSHIMGDLKLLLLVLQRCEFHPSR